MKLFRTLLVFFIFFGFPLNLSAQGVADSFEEMIRKLEWPKTDFSKALRYE